MINNDKLIIGGHEFNSRFILGSGKYSMKLIDAAVKDAGAEMITLAIRRANTKEHENILDYAPFNQFGKPQKIVKLFGGIAKFEQALKELELEKIATAFHQEILELTIPV